ncbi:MAG: MltA domain-containing protein [Thermoanaerobaculales bacterium]|jgi:membrane-bound lytic murein transglycosylase A|nr:MltA domain-containing protein [Thermoanaerobaculales bacterium]
MSASRRSKSAFAVLLTAILGGCAHGPLDETPPTILEVVAADEWPALVDDLEGARLADACDASLSFFERAPADRVYIFGAFTRTAAELAAGVRRSCELAILPPAARMDALQEEFLLLRSMGRDGRGDVLFTGYYEPLINARRRSEPPFEHPVYGVPDDLVTVHLADFGAVADVERIVGRVDDHRLIPYPERAAIATGSGIPEGTEVLGWVADPVDVFFLHVQGSGTLVFDDGSRLRAGYAASNGHPYRSIGRLLIDDGLVSRDEMSMQAIRAYLADNPGDLGRVLGANPSYVFFRPLPSQGGPLGCYDEPVTGGRSIATDRRLFPAPVMAWISATIPAVDGDDVPVERFVLNQDTGGSITGPGRVDLFFGQGDEAGDRAGRTKHLGQLYFLIPKSDRDPRPESGRRADSPPW